MKKKRPRIIPFVILTTITLVTWAVLDVWRTFNKPVPAEVPEAILKEFKPSLDQRLIDELQKSVFFSDEESRTILSQKNETPKATEGANISSGSGRLP